MLGSRKFSQGEGRVQIPRRGLTENFNMAKINNLAIPGVGGGGPEPLDPPMLTNQGLELQSFLKLRPALIKVTNFDKIFNHYKQ